MDLKPRILMNSSIASTTVDAIDVAWESGAAPAEYGVTFAYDYWTNAVTG